jgi:hypothetical protein
VLSTEQFVGVMTFVPVISSSKQLWPWHRSSSCLVSELQELPLPGLELKTVIGNIYLSSLSSCSKKLTYEVWCKLVNPFSSYKRTHTHTHTHIYTYTHDLSILYIKLGILSCLMLMDRLYSSLFVRNKIRICRIYALLLLCISMLFYTFYFSLATTFNFLWRRK